MDSFSALPPYRLTERELALWLRFIEYHVGFVLPSSQQSWMRGIIERYLLKLDLSHQQLFDQVSQNNSLFHQFFDEILIPRTQFFRHQATFDMVANYATTWKHQKYLQNTATLVASEAQNFMVWSVGSATGQEAVSLALTLSEVVSPVLQFKIWASDFHQQALAKAKLGQYDIAERSFIPEAYHKWLEVEDEPIFTVKPSLLERIDYFSFNLMQRHTTLPVLPQQCQVIMCQNVLIYFRQFEQRDILNFLSQYLADDGIFIMGAGEANQISSPALVKVANTSVDVLVKPTAPSWVKSLIVEH